jgi:tripartite-type tricarboxylate transporter receptor subunit TctC
MERTAMKHRIRLLLLAAASLAAAAAHAQAAFPSRAITVVSPYPPGGGSDTVMRVLQPKLAQLLGRPIVIDNKAGASGNIGTEFVVRAAPDGHTLLVNNSTLTINASLGARQPYDVQKDLRPIAAMVSTPVAVGVSAELPVRTLPELVEYARKQDGKLAWSSCGNGTPQHLAGLRFTQATRVTMTHVPYKGCGAAIADALGGAVPVLFNTVPNLETQAQAGRIRLLAVGAQQRLPFRPELPTIAESAGIRGFDAEVWFGLFAPAATPPEVVRKLEQAVLAAMADPEVQKTFADRSIAVRPLTGAQLQAQVQQDLGVWKKTVADFGLRLE